jgi:hypothetical protein
MKELGNIRIEGDRVIARHAPLKTPADVDEFLDNISAALEAWAQLRNLSKDKIAGELASNLVKLIASEARCLITPEIILQIQGVGEGCENSDGSKHLAKRIRDQLSDFIYEQLVALSAVTARGRPRVFGKRDREIFEAHQSGLSYGKIAIKQGIKRNAVQAAYHRDVERRRKVIQNYERHKNMLQSLGIDLKEELS